MNLWREVTSSSLTVLRIIFSCSMLDHTVWLDLSSRRLAMRFISLLIRTLSLEINQLSHQEVSELVPQLLPQEVTKSRTWDKLESSWINLSVSAKKSKRKVEARSSRTSKMPLESQTKSRNSPTKSKISPPSSTFQASMPPISMPDCQKSPYLHISI